MAELAEETLSQRLQRGAQQLRRQNLRATLSDSEGSVRGGARSNVRRTNAAVLTSSSSSSSGRSRSGSSAGGSDSDDSLAPRRRKKRDNGGKDGAADGDNENPDKTKQSQNNENKKKKKVRAAIFAFKAQDLLNKKGLLYLYHKQHRAGIDKFPGDPEFDEATALTKFVNYCKSWHYIFMPKYEFKFFLQRCQQYGEKGVKHDKNIIKSMLAKMRDAHKGKINWRDCMPPPEPVQAPPEAGGADQQQQQQQQQQGQLQSQQNPTGPQQRLSSSAYKGLRAPANSYVRTQNMPVFTQTQTQMPAPMHRPQQQQQHTPRGAPPTTAVAGKQPFKDTYTAQQRATPARDAQFGGEGDEVEEYAPVQFEEYNEEDQVDPEALELQRQVAADEDELRRLEAEFEANRAFEQDVHFQDVDGVGMGNAKRGVPKQ